LTLSDLGLITVLLSSLLLSRKLYRDIYTPLSIYIFIWTVCILLFRLRLVTYYELEDRTCWLIAGSLISFAIGCLLAGRTVPSDVRLEQTISPERLEYMIKLLFAANLVGASIFAYQMSSAYGLATYITDPAIIRQDFAEWTRVGPLGLLMMLDFPLLVCCWMHLLLTKTWRWFTVLSIPLISVQTFLRTDRGSLTIYAITCIALWIYWNRWTTLNWAIGKRLATVMCLLLCYFLGIGLVYGKLVSMQTDVFNLADLTVSSQFGLVLITPYIYATSPLGGFQAAIADVGQLSWGTHTFFPVARLLYALGAIPLKPEAFNFDFYQVPVPVNTYTHLYAFYQDFGVIGLLLIPLCLGFLQTRFYLRLKSAPTLFDLAACAAFVALNVFSIFVPLLTNISFWYFFVVIYVIYKQSLIRLGGGVGFPEHLPKAS
jgi:oligosaccharide repeat unit polymerase